MPSEGSKAVQSFLNLVFGILFLVAFVGLTIWSLVNLADALSSGVARLPRGGPVSIEEKPFGYWFAVLVHGAFGFLLAPGAIWWVIQELRKPPRDSGDPPGSQP